VTTARAGVGGGTRGRACRPVSPLVLAAALVGLLAGCSRAVDVAADVIPSPGKAAGVATAASPLSARSRAAAGPVDRLRGGLLGPRDLGPGWTGGVPPVPDPAAPAPCGGPGTVARFPDALRVGSTVDGRPGFVVQEALSVYRDAATASRAFRAGVAGLACDHGALHGAPVTIAPAEDLLPAVGGDQASGWQVGSEALDGMLVLVQARQAVFTFAYVAPAGTAPADRPDPLALSRVAVARVLAA
jgi:hypothetical protein